MTLDLEDLQRKAEAASKVEIVSTNTGGAFRSPDDAALWSDFVNAANPATVLELIAEVERLRANAEKMEKLYRGLSVERGDLQAEFIEMRSERDALKAQVAEERDWQNEIRKVCKEAMGGNTTFIDDDVARAITALKSQRDEMAEALGECEEVLALSEHTPLRDPAYHDRVKALGREIGFGAMMAIAERAWREVLEEKGYPVGSEHTAGACRSTVDATLRRAREALRNARTALNKETTDG